MVLKKSLANRKEINVNNVISEIEEIIYSKFKTKTRNVNFVDRGHFIFLESKKVFESHKFREFVFSVKKELCENRISGIFFSCEEE